MLLAKTPGTANQSGPETTGDAASDEAVAYQAASLLSTPPAPQPEAPPVATASLELSGDTPAPSAAPTAAVTAEGAGAGAGGDAIGSIDAIVNDIGYTNGSLWGMYGDVTAVTNIYGSQAGEAWDLGITGSMKTVVGVVDTGMNYTHPDLYLNVWLNQGEIPVALKKLLVDVDRDGLITFRDLNDKANAAFVTDINKTGYIDAGDLLNDKRWENGIDDDKNGYLDDLIGWDFANNDNDPWDDNGHGTHVSGTIGAIGGNDIGVAGINWNIQMVGLKYAGANGSGNLYAAAMALDYFTNASKTAVNQDFVATNNSWSASSEYSLLKMSIENAAKAGILTVASAGNNQRDNDTYALYPSSYNTTAAAGYDGVISVASLSAYGGLSWFSNYGAKSVDIAAPGEGILSTTSDGGYGVKSGTSMAAPHVTGAIALYASLHPEATAAQIRQALLDSAAATDGLLGRLVSGGRLDIDAMLHLDDLRPKAPPAPEPEPERQPQPPASGGATEPPPPPPNLNLVGTKVADLLVGGAGDDTISGVAANDAKLGRGTVDRLTGGEGHDLFILGDARGAFYDNDTSSTAGAGDYAVIQDFQAGDRIQVSYEYAQYFFRANVKKGDFTGTALYADSNANGAWDKTDELIGLVVGAPVSQSDLVFAGTRPAALPSQYVLGTIYTDKLTGTDGNDTISGVPADGTQLGHGTRDELTGGAGADLFILGDARGAFYDDGVNTQNGAGHFAIIHDFEDADRLQVSSEYARYFFRENITKLELTGTALYADSNGSGKWDNTDELIALIVGAPVTQSHLIFA